MRAPTLLSLLLIGILAGGEPTSDGGPSTAPLVIAMNQESEPPWVLPSGEGIDQRLVMQASLRSGIPVRFLPLPWPRCLAQLEAGTVDGLLNVSYTPEWAAFARYPRGPKGAVDEGRRLHRDTYSLFLRRGDQLTWSPDGGFQGPVGLVAAQQGYHIVGILRQQGVAVDDSVQGLLTNLEKLAAGRVQAAALHTRFVTAILDQRPDLAERIAGLPTPLATLDYYLVLSRRSAARRPDPAGALWTAIDQLRAGSDYRAWCLAAGVPAD